MKWRGRTARLVAAAVAGLAAFSVGAAPASAAAASVTVHGPSTPGATSTTAPARPAAAGGNAADGGVIDATSADGMSTDAAAVATAAGHTAAVVPTPIGADVSYPQCTTQASISTRPFAVIGVNGGKASTMNPCFSSEYNAALLLSGVTEQPHAAVYLNTGNPGLAASFWPSANVTQAGTAVANPTGTCAHKADASCAFVYGYSMAEADYDAVTVSDGFSAPPVWWLDVETTNSWSPTDTAGNTASIEGMQSFLQSKGLEVGIYSTSYQFGKIAGKVPPTSALAGLRSWLAGASPTTAARDCATSAPLTPGGRVSLVQYVVGSGATALDNDYSCHLFTPVAPTITGGAQVGARLVSHHATWAPVPVPVSYTYQWYANGAAISGATESSYAVAKSDLGKVIVVRITGRATGYAPLAIDSPATAPVTRAFTTTPAPVPVPV